MTVEVLYSDKKITPQQIILDVTNQIEQHKPVSFAIIYEDNNGRYRSHTTDMSASELHFLGAILQSTALDRLETGEL